MLAHASPSASVDCAARIRATCTDLDETLTTNASFNSFGYRWFARWHLCPPDQGFNCLYRERKQVAQCLASRSACASRCTVAKPRSGAPVSTRFFAELASQIVGKVRQHRAGATCFVNRLSRSHVPEAAASLIDGLVRPSCAVVGNSPLVLQQNAGPSIDRHDVVIRFNFAPTRGFERHVGTKTSVRFMGKTWVWSKEAGDRGPEPILIHRYNQKGYFLEDLRLNLGYNIATLDHPFTLHGFGMGRRVQSVLSKGGMFDDAELQSLHRFAAMKDEKAPVSSGFSGLLFAMYACSHVSLYGFDVEGTHPGHYYNDTRDGVVARVAELLRREPIRKDSFSVDPGLFGFDVTFIRDQYTREKSDHPFQLERGIIRAWTESGCLRAS